MRRSLVHPKTGMLFAPVGYRRNGTPIWPFLGASEDDEGSDGDNNDAGGTGSEGDGAEEGDESQEDESQKRDPRIKALSDEAARNRVKAKELAAELEKARAALKVIEDKDKSEVEKLTGEVKDLQAKHDKVVQELQEVRLQNAFLSSNKFQWHNPDRALKLADLSEVEIDDDGKVTGLDKALDALAKSDPYLIKSESSEDDNEGKSGSSGAPIGSSKDSKKKAADRARLEKKYPALLR